VDEPLIRASGLTKRYDGRTVVDGLDLAVREGEIYGLLGPNGAGKTTTILMLLGLSEPSAGRARVVGLDPARQALEVKRRVGYLPDDAGFYADLTGRENLRYTAALNGLAGNRAEASIGDVLDRVGLTDAADQKAGQYSRGMRQRLGIADALIKDPVVLILDEPTIGIDPLGVVEILTLIRALVAERGMALLLSSHLLDQVQATCDRVGIFVAGRLIAEGRVAELARRYGTTRERLAVAFDDAAGHRLDRPSAERLLRALPGVTGVDSIDPGHPDAGPAGGIPPGTTGWVVSLAPDAAVPSVRHDLLRRVGEAGLPLAELRLLVPSLGEIYRRAVEADAPAAGTEPAA